MPVEVPEIIEVDTTRVCCDGTGGGGADRGDFAGVDRTDGCAGLGIKEEDEALVRLDAAREVPGKDADELGTEGGVRAHGAGHDAEQAAIG